MINKIKKNVTYKKPLLNNKSKKIIKDVVEQHTMPLNDTQSDTLLLKCTSYLLFDTENNK